MSHIYRTFCDSFGCPAWYETDMGKSYDVDKLPGHDWMRVGVTGDRQTHDFCPKCSEGIKAETNRLVSRGHR